MQPRTLFLIDFIGAGVTAITLGIIFPAFPEYIGLPNSTLYRLAAVALAFLCYSLWCFLRAPVPAKSFLRIIGFLNLFYVIISSIIVYSCWSDLHLPARIYFTVELAIILALAAVEIHTSARDRPKI